MPMPVGPRTLPSEEGTKPAAAAPSPITPPSVPSPIIPVPFVAAEPILPPAPPVVRPAVPAVVIGPDLPPFDAHVELIPKHIAETSAPIVQTNSLQPNRVPAPLEQVEANGLHLVPTPAPAPVVAPPAPPPVVVRVIITEVKAE